LIGLVELVIPKTSLEIMKKVVRAYYLTHSDNGVTVREVHQNTGYVESQINKSNKFLLVINILEKINSKFKLTKDGYQYAKLQRDKKIDDANRILYQLIKSYEAINLITNYVEIQETATYDELVTRIAEVSSSDIDIKDHKTGINCLIEILVESKILIQDENMFSISEE